MLHACFWQHHHNNCSMRLFLDIVCTFSCFPSFPKWQWRLPTQPNPGDLCTEKLLVENPRKTQDNLLETTTPGFRLEERYRVYNIETYSCIKHMHKNVDMYWYYWYYWHIIYIYIYKYICMYISICVCACMHACQELPGLRTDPVPANGCWRCSIRQDWAGQKTKSRSDRSISPAC